MDNLHNALVEAGMALIKASDAIQDYDNKINALENRINYIEQDIINNKEFAKKIGNMLIDFSK